MPTTRISVTTEPTTADVLRAVRDLLTPPERWHRENFSGTNDDGTRCFCVLGALGTVLDDPGMGSNHPAKTVIEDAIAGDPRSVQAGYSNPIPAFNDHPATKHSDVLAALDRAIATALLDEVTARG